LINKGESIYQSSYKNGIKSESKSSFSLFSMSFSSD